MQSNPSTRFIPIASPLATLMSTVGMLLLVVWRLLEFSFGFTEETDTTQRRVRVLRTLLAGVDPEGAGSGAPVRVWICWRPPGPRVCTC